MRREDATGRVRARPARVRVVVAVSAWILGGALLPVVVVTTAATPAHAASAPPSSCLSSSSPPTANPPITPYSNTTSPLLLPAWGDAGGWSQPEQYQTILSGDLEGDGYGDLVGRNGTTVEADTVAPPLRPAVAGNPDPSTDAPLPGQWVPKAAADPPAVPERGTLATMPGQALGASKNAPDQAGGQVPATLAVDVPGFSDPGRYQTFRLANLDGAPGDELLVRQPMFSTTPSTSSPLYWPTGSGAPANPPTYLGTFLLMYRYDATRGRWADPVQGPRVDDSAVLPQQYGQTSNGWDDPQYFDTIMTGNVDGGDRDEIVLRGPDMKSGQPDPTRNAGVTVWKLDPAGTAFDEVGNPSDLLTSSEGFGDPSQYTTLRLADFTGDGKADLVARFPNGLNLYEWNGVGWVYTTDVVGGGNATLPNWSNANGGNQPQLTGSIGFGNLDGKDRNEVFALESGGLKAYKWVAPVNDPGSGSWVPLVAGSTSILTGQANAATGALWTAPAYYETIQAGDVLGTPADQILARAGDGVHVYTYDPTSQSFQDRNLTQTQFSDANGWDQAMRYETIKTAFVHTGRPRALIGRDATGVRTYVLPDAQAARWQSPSAAFPAWANGADATGYAPATLSTNDAAARAYNYLNEQVGNQLWPNPSYPGQPPKLPATIRSQYTNLVQDMATVAAATQAVKPRTLNVPRQTWTAVKQQMSDWTLAVQRLRNAFFDSSGAASIQQILLNSLMVGDTAYSANAIETQFNAKDTTKMWALIGDLIWGIVGGLPTGDSATLGFVFSMIGAGTAAGLTYAPKSKYQDALNLEAQDLDLAVANAFCQANAFLYGSHDQAVADLGLLLGMDEAIIANPVTSATVLKAETNATRGRAVWMYQQFAALSSTDDGGWRIMYQPAYCGPIDKVGTGYCSGMSEISTVNTDIAKGPLVGVYWAYPINKTCESKSDGLQTAALNTLVQQLGVDPLDLVSPSWTFWSPPSGNAKAPNPGDPQLRDAADENGNTVHVTGLLGWHTQVQYPSLNTPNGCEATRGPYVPYASS